MFNTYPNSVLWPIKAKNRHEYFSLLPESSETYRFSQASTSSRCCCASSLSRSRCCCCSTTSSSSSFVKPKVSISSGFVVYGLRQSTLIQWPSFRKRLLVGVGVSGGRLLGCEADVHCCESEVYSSCVGTRRNRGFKLRASEECGRRCSDDVEAMISFLSEELIDEDRNCIIEERKKVRYGGNVRRVNVEGSDTCGNGRVTQKAKREGLERPEGFGRHEYRRNGIREDVKMEEKYDCEHCKGRKKNSELESDFRRGSKLVASDSVGKNYREKEEREVRPRRTKSSSCSSYYSLGSSGDFESDTEDQDEDMELRRENLRSSEKKAVEQSTKGVKSRKEVSWVHSRKKKDEIASGVSSSYRKQVFEEGENSNQAVTLNQRRRKQVTQTGSKVSESAENYEEDMEIQEIHVNDVEMNSQNQTIFGERADHTVSSIRSDSRRENIESSQQQLKERSGACYSSEERVSEIRRNVVQNYPEATSNQQPLVEERLSKQPLVEERLSKQTGMRMSTERFSENSEIYDIDIRNTYVSQSEDRIRNQEVQAGLVSGSQSEGRQQDYHIEQIPSQKMQSDRTHVFVSHTSDAVRYSEIKRNSEKMIIGQGSNTIVELDSKAGKSDAQKDSKVDHAKTPKEGQKAFGFQSSQEKLSEESSSSQSSLTLVSRNRSQLVNLVSEEMQGSETTLIPPSSQLVSRGSGKSYGTGGVSFHEISHGTSESGYPTAFEHPRGEAIVHSQSAGELMKFTTQEDALGSAHRLEQSSEKFIGEFVKKAKHEVSTPETQRQIPESNQLKRRDSKRSSGGSGVKGPSDEMWVTNSAQGTPQLEATEGNAAEGNAIFKRSGRSLWSVIGDIARLRWGSRAGSPDSSAKPTGKSSPNESISSATWFSGREHDGSSDDNSKGDKVLPQEAASLHQLAVGQTSSGSQFESSDATKLKQQSGKNEALVSSPSTTIQEGGSATYHMPSTSSDQIVGVGEEEGADFEFRLSGLVSTEVPMRLPSRNLIRSPAIKEPSGSSPTGVSSDQNVSVGEGRHYQARVPEMSPVVVPSSVQRPLLLPGRNLRSAVIKEPSQPRPTVVSGSSLREQVTQQQPLSAKSQEESGSAPTDSTLVQRKLQRNKQVVRDSFEEWEEAYKVDAERRTLDEIFMREALIEAKKAADIWEVPVGAVLVHDGKIIARGFNLVEDLRDSTAHAEMICIREGSKALRSWRLADTTLYVTLEPCPMCAGAILQARVNTLVWGAPNKLLGADGSWIRLFPGGEGNGSEVSEKPPPPVHPFHPKMTIRRGVLESECAQTMQQFFQLRRKKKDKNTEPPAPSDHHHHHLHPSKLLNKMHQVLPFFCL